MGNEDPVGQYEPGGHGVVQAVASLVVLLQVPASHFMQFAAETSPTLLPQVPTGQLLHCELFVKPVVEVHVPRGHGFVVPDD